MEIIYRKAEIADIPDLVVLRKQQLQGEGENDIEGLNQPLVDYYSICIPSGEFVSWLALHNGKIIATSGVSFVRRLPHGGNHSGRIGILSSMFTMQEYRRKGIAKELLGFIVKEARAQGCGSVQITASQLGMRLYENFGFEIRDNFMQFHVLDKNI